MIYGIMINMEYYFDSNEIEKKEILPGVFQQILSGSSKDETMMVVRYIIKEGAVFPEHEHPHEQHGYLIEGEADFIIGGVKKRTKTGDGYIIPGNVLHGAVFLKDSIVIDVFSPPREDFLK